MKNPHASLPPCDHDECGPLACPQAGGSDQRLVRFLEVIERPLLVSGQLRQRMDTSVPVILIDSEQAHDEKLLTLWHEVVHLLRMAGGFPQDEDDVEAAAKRLAAACPEALAWVGIHEANDQGHGRRTVADETTD